ncbi:MAG TPA: BON domain-containing protein [Candidatus Angelobacter sp.]|jgi:hyperosmotically inducible protein|nr:BON domain-containing protein [Candidatus Angelobacter sp.]
MKRVLHVSLAIALMVGMRGLAAAQSSGHPMQSSATGNVDTNPRMEQRIVKEVRHELVMLPQLSVFDNLAYKVDGSTVTLLGQVRNAVLKDEAEHAVKHIEGVEKVDNQIEILPASFNDDRIRRQVARAIFNEPRLFNYAIQSNPPIHIIVKNGRVDLEGVVHDQGDKNVAGIMANGVPGVFAVQNNLQVEEPSKK